MASLTIKKLLRTAVDHDDEVLAKRARQAVARAARLAIESLKESLPASVGSSLDKLLSPKGRPSKAAIKEVADANERSRREWAEHLKSGDRVPMASGPNLVYDESDEATRAELQQVATGQLDLIKRHPDGKVDFSTLKDPKWTRLKWKFDEACRQLQLEDPCKPLIFPDLAAKILDEVLEVDGLQPMDLDSYARGLLRPETNKFTREMARLSQMGIADRLAGADQPTVAASAAATTSNDGQNSTPAESPSEREPQVIRPPTLAAEAWLSPADVQRQFPHFTVNAVGKLLARWRRKHDDGWREVTERRPREAQYLYRWGAVRTLFVAAGETASERRAN